MEGRQLHSIKQIFSRVTLEQIQELLQQQNKQQQQQHREVQQRGQYFLIKFPVSGLFQFGCNFYLIKKIDECDKLEIMNGQQLVVSVVWTLIGS